MRGEQAIFNLEIKKKSGLSINPDIHHSKVFSSGCTSMYYKYRLHRMDTQHFIWRNWFLAEIEGNNIAGEKGAVGEGFAPLVSWKKCIQSIWPEPY